MNAQPMRILLCSIVAIAASTKFCAPVEAQVLSYAPACNVCWIFQPVCENQPLCSVQNKEVSAFINKSGLPGKAGHDRQDGKPDTNAFTLESWLGHWESEDGRFWIVISNESELDIVVSSDGRRKVTNVKLSDDFRHLNFFVDDRWKHELTLSSKNKYKADHSNRDDKNDGPDVWGTGTLYKLIRPTTKSP